MSKELYVSLTPHETKVALTEDDQLAEIYFERENEYTLAGSIYKGRVTRVLPGMQSAFVDIGLERDAFLYVSDFFEMEEEDEEIEPVRIQPPRAEARPFERQERPPRPEPPQAAFSAAEQEEEEAAEADQGGPSPIVFEGPEPAESPAEAEARVDNTEQRGDDRGGWRGGNNRRRRRGRRGGRGFSENKFTHSPGEEAREGREPREARESYGPPPGYQPILLPGESISKYQRYAPQPVQAVQTEEQPVHDWAASEAPEVPAEAEQHVEPEAGAAEPAAEPVAEAPAESPVIERPTFQEEYVATPVDEPAEERAAMESELGTPSAQHLVLEQQEQQKQEEDAHRYDEMNVATVFGGEEATRADVPTEQSPSVSRQPLNVMEGESIAKYRRSPRPEVEAQAEEQATEAAEAYTEPQPAPAPAELTATAPGTMEEEEIEEEETELPTFSEHIDDNEIYYEELEEETFEPERARAQGELPGEALTEAVEEAEEEREAIEAYEGDEEEGEPAAGDEESEAAQAEMRGPSATAGYQQRVQRPTPFDRRRGRRGGGRMKRGPRPEQRHHVQIADVLKEGQEVLVQIAKEPIGKKGARITSHIALPGRFMVFMPSVNHIGVSRKIGSEEERQRLKRIVMSERNGHGGFIVRTAAEGISEQELLSDIRFLKSLWNEIKTRADNAKPPALIYHDLNLVERTLRDLLSEDFTHVWVDNEQEYERILRFVNRFQPNLVRRVRLYTKDTPLYEQFGVQEEINKALKSKVWLKSGGYIVINQTEALVAIDVNTGKYVGKTTRLEDTIVKTNVDAIKEIVRQIRLRDLGGIIVIDFIDMDERKNRQKVMQALEEALKTDRAPSKVLQFNDFGLVAITRKRVKHSLERTLGSLCSYCTGTGYVKSVETVCNEIYTEMKKVRRQLEGRDITLRVNPEVAKALKGNNARWLNDLEELTGRSIIVKADATLHQEQFDM